MINIPLFNPYPQRTQPIVLNGRTMKHRPMILLIDDDEIFIFLTRNIIEATGKAKNIVVKQSAAAAIELLDKKASDPGALPDMILLDLNMPEMNGWDFLQHYQQLMKKMAKVPRLYVVSSSISDSDSERAMKIKGVTGFITKPLRKELIDTILSS
jgi:CheY-like chemotaxis protein